MDPIYARFYYLIFIFRHIPPPNPQISIRYIS